MSENISEIRVTLAKHEERISRNREEVEQNKKGVEACEKAADKALFNVNIIKVENSGRDVRIAQLQWFVLLIAASIATLAFAILRQGVVR